MNWSLSNVGTTNFKMVSFGETRGKWENKMVCDGNGTSCCPSAWTGTTRAFFCLRNKMKGDAAESWRKEVEGYPTWEGAVNQIKKVEQSDLNLVTVDVIGRWIGDFIEQNTRQVNQ